MAKGPPRDVGEAAKAHARDDMANMKDAPPAPGPAQPEPRPAEPPGRGSAAPSTSGVLWAAWRQGLKDLQDRVLNPWHGQSTQRDEPGSIANPTQMDVYEEKHREQPAHDYDPAEHARPGQTPTKDRGRGR